MSSGFEDGRMLYLGGHDVTTCGKSHGVIIGLRTAGGKEDLLGQAAEERGDLFTSAIDEPCGGTSDRMEGGWITEYLTSSVGEYGANAL